MIKINTKKLEEIKEKLKKENFCVVLDFDRTITSRESSDSWDASGKLLGEEFAKKLYDLYIKYRPIEQDYTISIQEKEKAMETWYQECMDLYYEYHLTKEILDESINSSNLCFRTGAKEFLENLHKNDIPVIILSAGIGNVIEKYLSDNNCYYENMHVISNFIKFDKDGNMEKFNAKMIHSLNKTMKGKLSDELKEKMSTRKYKILAGDLIEDRKMVDESELNNTITFGILDEKIDENKEAYNKYFDVVLTRRRC